MGRTTILSPEQPQTLPPSFRLEGVVLSLQARGDLRGVIGLVETWSATEEPTPAARLAQAGALVRLGLVDKAWARIRDMVDQEGASAETLGLTAELFLARQWPKRARDVLNRGLAEYPDDPKMKALWDRMSEPATTPDLDAVEDDNADVASLITAAHHLIASGSHTLARTLLERAQRLDPANAQTADMLWALDGDFALDRPLSELVQEHQADLSHLADLEEEPEHTESVDMADVPDDRTSSGNFPNLFRDLEPRTEMIDPHDFASASEEITKVTSMMDLSSMDTIVDQTFTGEHTEIQRVITHAALGDDTDGESAFDLSDLQSDLPPELEDDDVVVITRREDDVSEPHPDEESKLVLDEPSAPPAGRSPRRQQADEAETWILPQRQEPEKKKRPSPKRKKPDVRPLPDATDDAFDNIHEAFSPPRSSLSVWIFAFVGIFALIVALLLLLVALGLVSA